MDSAGRVATLQYLHTSGAVTLLESITKTLLDRKPPPGTVLRTLRVAARDWTPLRQRPVSCAFVTTDGAEWRIGLDGGRPAAHRNGKFVQYVNKVTCDVVRRRVALDTVTATADSSALLVCAEDWEDVARSLADFCTACGVPKSFTAAEPLVVTSSSGELVEFWVTSGRLVWRRGGRHCGSVARASCGLAPHVLLIDDGSAETHLELPPEGLREALAELAALCDAGGVPHDLAQAEPIRFRTTGDEAWRLQLEGGRLAAQRECASPVYVEHVACDVAARRLTLKAEGASAAVALELPGDGFERLLSDIQALCDSARVPHALASGAVRFRTAGGSEVRVELEEGWPAVYVDDVFHVYVTSAVCDVVSGRLALDKQTRPADAGALQLPLRGLRHTLSQLQTLLEGAGVPHSLDHADPIEFTTLDSARVRIAVEDGWPVAHVNGAFRGYVTGITADVALRRLALDKQTRPDDPDALSLGPDGFLPLLEKLQALSDGLAVPSQLCTFRSAAGARWRLEEQGGRGLAAIRDGAFVRRVTHFRWDATCTRLAFDQGVALEGPDAVVLPPKGARGVLCAVAALCHKCAVPHAEPPPQGAAFRSAAGQHWRVELHSDEWPAATRDGVFVQYVTCLRWDPTGRRVVFDQSASLDGPEAVVLPAEGAREALEAIAAVCDDCDIPHAELPHRSGVAVAGPEAAPGASCAASAGEEEAAARKIQALQRGREGRKRAKMEREQRLAEQDEFFENEDREYMDQCAKVIQGLVVRKFLRKMRGRVTDRQQQEAAALKIQRQARGRQGRKRAQQRRVDRETEQDELFRSESEEYINACARIIQSVAVKRFIRKVRSRRATAAQS
eukprot:TRINITY_DN10010_c0_g1_i1.p1 TRINITY_DN10010_c0_g1~~TRINITY_DN10010_c0_g1_i1.p1  ORF type:complete len:882 (+),score=214.14 TRINITY_DN10010_c0_g1_i1:103-2646(+)